MSNTCSVSGHFSVQRLINYGSEWHLGFEEKSVFALKQVFLYILPIQEKIISIWFCPNKFSSILHFGYGVDLMLMLLLLLLLMIQLSDWTEDESTG